MYGCSQVISIVCVEATAAAAAPVMVCRPGYVGARWGRGGRNKKQKTSRCTQAGGALAVAVCVPARGRCLIIRAGDCVPCVCPLPSYRFMHMNGNGRGVGSAISTHTLCPCFQRPHVCTPCRTPPHLQLSPRIHTTHTEQTHHTHGADHAHTHTHSFAFNPSPAPRAPSLSPCLWSLKLL
jgi:hypothetical protein